MKQSKGLIEPHCVSAWIVDKRQERPHYLLLKRCSPYLKGTWQMVSGAIEGQETAWQAAVREIREETGFLVETLYTVDYVELFYLAQRDKIAFAAVFAAFAQGEAQLSPREHDAYEWLPYEKCLTRLLFDGQRQALTRVHHSFGLSSPPAAYAIDVSSSAKKQDMSKSPPSGSSSTD